MIRFVYVRYWNAAKMAQSGKIFVNEIAFKWPFENMAISNPILNLINALSRSPLSYFTFENNYQILIRE